MFFKNKINKSLTVFALASTLTAMSANANSEEYKIDLSLETGPNHIRNISIKKWVDEVEAATQGRLKINIYDGASKFKGSSVPTALAQGTLDMGVPGTWQLTKILPNYGVIFTPIFFGLKRDSMYEVMDGSIGRELINQTESKLNVKVIGRFIDIGGAITFTKDRPIKKPEDYTGLRIRVAGSVAHVRRYEALGANAVKISWPDVPQALQTGMVDGVMTAFESVRSAKLWDSGIKFAYIDNQSFHQYVPMINRKVWDGLPEDIQDAIESTWEKNVDTQREYTETRNVEAMKVAQQNGIEISEATDEDIYKMRMALMKIQASVVEETGVDKNISENVTKQLIK